MSEATLETANALIERMKTATRSGCAGCERISYDSACFKAPEQLDGFEPSVSNAGFVRRCETCRNTLAWPWADKLAAEKVLEFMRTHEDSPFYLGELEQTL